jgi:sugar O-acyltransferase (sialic acid O-acetyltransferase NeuD family)
MDKPVMILGASSIGMAAYEIFRSHHLMVYGFLDDREDLHGKEFDDVIVMGSTDDDGYLKFIGPKCEAFVSTDDNEERKGLVKMLIERRKVMPVNAIHSNASLAQSAAIAHGNFIDDGVIIGANCEIGNHNLIRSGAILEHEVKLGNFIQIGVGAIISAGVSIKDEAFIGAGAIIVSGIEIGKTARIGTGSVVVDHVPDNATVFGNPAKPVSV